ncbi:MAG: TetR/AcrR family transcriptional regulator [Gammaproteobacteria bacterium]|nr:TetR/AcrR family transcriptional regulator [Gammaproteobacteria bacterium]
MTKSRGKYASPVQTERRERILVETLKLLEAKQPEDISMSLISERSGVSTKTLYNLFKNRNGLLLAAAARINERNQSNTSALDSLAGIPRILELTRRAMESFTQSPEFISADEESEFHRVGRTQEWFHEALRVAKSEGDLLPDTDCLQLSQMLTASQWGSTLLWQKKLISLEALRQQTMLQHCFDLMPFCTASRRQWLASLKTAIQGKTLDFSSPIGGEMPLAMAG